MGQHLVGVLEPSLRAPLRQASAGPEGGQALEGRPGDFRAGVVGAREGVADRGERAMERRERLQLR